MPPRVLDVGQCGPDHAALCRLLAQHGATVDRTDGMADTLAALRGTTYALVLVNRKLDADYSDGMEIIRAIKQDSALATVPVMLISNYADAQEAAVAAGALYGFGKAELARPETADKLRALFDG